MTFKTLDDLTDIAGKRVLVRVDLNVPVKDGQVTDTTRIERVAPTIRELSEKGAKVVLLAHFGRPNGEPVADMSLKAIASAVEEILDQRVYFAADCIGDKAANAIAELNDGEVLLLENTRFHKGEEKNDPDFVTALAANGDIYVNDAFSAAHRAHASTEGLAHHLPAYAGRTMQAEPKRLKRGSAIRSARSSRSSAAPRFDQDRPSAEPREEGRRAGHRRRHGQHLPRGARRRCRKVALRARSCGDRQGHPRGRLGSGMRNRASGRRRRCP